jgi:hypothetical protein
LVSEFFILRYKKYEEEVQQKLMKLKEHEDEIVKKHGCELEMLQPKLDCALNQNSKMLATGIRVDEKFSLTKKEKIEPQQKLEENSSSKEQVGLMTSQFALVGLRHYWEVPELRHQALTDQLHGTESLRSS